MPAALASRCRHPTLGVRDGAAGKGPADIARTLGIARASVYRTLSA